MFYLDNDLDKAEEHFNNAIQLNPKEHLVNMNLGIIKMKKGFKMKKVFGAVSICIDFGLYYQ